MSIEIAEDEAGTPLIAICGTCGDKWIRPGDDAACFSLAPWFAEHRRIHRVALASSLGRQRFRV